MQKRKKPYDPVRNDLGILIIDMDKKTSNRIKIGIDARLWSQTGVGRYIRNICIGLHEIDNKNSYVLIVRKDDKGDVEKHIKKKNWKLVETNLKWHSLKEQIYLPGLLKKQNLDLVHFPYFDIPFFYSGPFVITIHDLIYHHFMTGKSSTNAIWLYGFKMLAYRIVINNAARKAKKVIAVSDSTKNEILDHLMINKSNVEVIYEAVDDFRGKATDKKEGKYFLFVGNVYPHKNTDNLIKAFNKVLEKSDSELIFVGSDDFFYSRLKKQVSKLIKEKKVIIKENVTDDELAAYYSNAIALVRPSFMEGFSLPPLEAMSQDCLVIASDIPVHKEILGSSAIYFNPNDSVDLEEKMLYVLNLDENKKQDMAKKGKQLADKFSWEKAARQTLDVYESSVSLRQVK